MSSTDNLHVAFVISIGSGGLPHYTVELANELAKEVTVSVLKPTETTADGYFDESVDVHSVFEDSDLSFVNLLQFDISIKKIINSFQSYAKISKINEIEPDIVHFSDGVFPPTKAFATYEEIFQNYCTVVTLHEVYTGLFSEDQELYRNPGIAVGVLGKKLLNSLIPSKSPSCWIVHTGKHRDQLADKGKDKDSVHVVPHGTYSLFDSDRTVTKEENTILFFGKIVPAKALDTVVESTVKASHSIPEIKLIIAGEGPIPDGTKDLLQRYPQYFEINNNFIPNEKVGEYFQRSDIVVVPHRYQGGHSGTLTIALNFEKPVVASDVGEVGEIVERSGCGLVSDPEDTEEFAEKIETLLKDTELYERCVDNAAREAELKSWENVAEEHLSLYVKLLS